MSDAFEGTTALVTGGAGFIGSHIAAALAEPANVRVLDDFSSGSVANVPGGIRMLEGDICDEMVLAQAMEGVDVVFHQAGLASVTASVDNPVASHHRNATGTLAVLEAARRADARVVLASSAAIYGPPTELPITEEHPKRPTTPYGVDKLAADRYASIYADRYGLPTVALRYFNVYGPGQSTSAAGVVSAFLDRARSDDPITIHGDGTQTRDFVHVADVVRANLLAARTDASGTAFNIGTGTGTSIAELADLVRDSVDGAVPIEHTAQREGDIDHSRADITRASNGLGFDPKVSLRDGIAALAAQQPVADHPAPP
ncbi:NAD-dependent epimerase/dehydratase family protein [Salinibaculum salinum]|uniref:NAD-dependent epimerase/dehydratase family protein n=1 Tax=Salinibaculum salinum TaxID=3131996 RepID=UPI0030EE883E